MPLQETSGNSTQDAYGGGAAVVANYIEDVFSTWLYTGTGASQTITNGIDLSTKGGMVWLKTRSFAFNNYLNDTARGITNYLSSNQTQPQNWVATVTDMISSVNTTGFVLGSGATVNGSNNSGYTFTSWTFRKQPKFFDVVTWTGDGSANRQISHNLGSKPGFIVYKCTNTTGDWNAIARITDTSYSFGLKLNATNAQYTATNPSSTISTTWFVPEYFNGSIPDSNASGNTYVAYLFASNAGGFGLTGTDNVISCGSFTTDGAGSATVSLGYEPQWLMVKSTGVAQNWFVIDNMRGFSYSAALNLKPNTSGAEADFGPNAFVPTATGFVETASLSASQTYIYIAIRRGPMAVPTDATKVFIPVAANVTGANFSVTTGFPVDLVLSRYRAGYHTYAFDRLRGDSTSNYVRLTTDNTNAEATGSNGLGLDNNTGFVDNYDNYDGGTGNYIFWNFQRAPSFFDEVCYTGNGSTQTITHNLGVVPELIIAKNRGQAGNNWPVLFNFASTTMNYGFLNLTNSCPNDTYANVGVFSASPTSTQMFLVSSGSMNGSGYGIVAYLFATCAGVSKVGTYTGNGTTQAIACGFTGGARFVLIKRTDSTGGWYVYDTARGMTTLTDPYLFLNSTAAETATLGSVTTTTGGFTVNAAILAAINTSSASYIFLAIA
jgi:hypothetical protein